MTITNRSVSLTIEGRVKRLALTLLLVVGAGGPAGAQIGEIFDPAGDAINPGGTSDLASARVAVQGSNVRLEVRYAPGTFNAEGTTAQFLLDTDQNVATGSPGADNGCSPPDNALLGVDYGVQLRSLNGTVIIVQALGGCNNFAFVANSLVVEEVANGMNVTLPRSLLGGDDGRLNFKVTTMTQLSGSNFSFIQDRMSNPGLPVGTVGGLPNTMPCVRDAMTACLLDDRFEVKVKMWSFATPPVLFPGTIQTYQGASSETDESVSFYSFEEGNVELFVKMKDACAAPSFVSFWLFAAGATNAETEVLVRDTTTGETRRIHNDRAALFPTVADTRAFLSCS